VANRFPIDDRSTVYVNGVDASDGYGARPPPIATVGGPSATPGRTATLNPDGTGLGLWSGVFRDEEAGHTYGGGFAPDGTFYANYFPMYNMTEASGSAESALHRGGAVRR
jgi:hypothetical protein